MRANYPNVELLAYRAEELYEKYVVNEQVSCVRNPDYLDTQVYVFRQTWANTATGIDLHGGVSGQAITDAYTTVVEIDFNAKSLNPKSGVDRHFFFVVFFGDRYAYCGFDPDREFYDDVTNCDMKSQRKQDYFK